MQVTESLELGAVVDRLGQLLAKKAELEREEEALKQVLKDAGVEAVEGELFRATISRFETTKIDYKTICEKLNPSHQLVAAHTSSRAQTTVRVVARNGRK